MSLKLRVSKTDPSAHSVTRTLQCLCEDVCDLKCPYAVMEVLLHETISKDTKDGALAVATDENRSRATKSELVDSWATLFNIPVTGHSTRRSGALQYIRRGWAVSQVAFLGRWKSNLIIQYAQEALESMAVNVGGRFGKGSHEISAEDMEKDLAKMENKTSTETSKESWDDLNTKMAMLESEIKNLKTNTKESRKEFEKSVNKCEKMVSTSSKYLPNLVQSDRHRVVHINSHTLVHAPAYLWRTLCGWNFYASVYTFMEGDVKTATCSKCIGRASSEVEGATKS